MTDAPTNPLDNTQMINVANTSAEHVIITAGEYRRSKEVLMGTAVGHRIELHRDYTTAAFAVLGAAVTVLTIAPDLAKTPALLYLGSAILLLAIIVAFVSRHLLGGYAQNLVASEGLDYGRVTNVARNFQRQPLDPVASDAFFTTLSQPSSKKDPKFGWLCEHGSKLVGGLVFVGAVLVVIALLLYVRI